MTELRDARLRKAMDAAPDAQLQPHARTREAIRAAAHGAVQPAWKRWWPRGGTGTTGWAAALATFVVASLVAVLWEGREVPGARTETDVVARAPAPAAVPPPPPAAVPAPLPPAAAPAAAPPPAAAAPQVSEPDALPAPRPLPAPPREKREAAAAPPVLADEAPAAAEALARGTGAARKQQRIENDAAESPAVAAAPPPPPAAAPAPAAPAAGAGSPAATAQRQAAPAAPSATLRAAPTALPWSQVRIESGGRAVVVPRAQAGRLPALVTSLLASPPADAHPGATGSLRLELGQGDEAAGVLEQVGGRWRWTPLREGNQARWLRPEPEVAAALEEEIRRLLER